IFDILKQHQNEVNEIRAEKIARNANPLMLVAAAQHYPDNYSPDTYYQAPKLHKTNTSSTRHTISTSFHANTRNKGKEIGKPITPPSKSASEDDSDPDQAQRDKDMHKNLALITKYIKNIYKPTNNNLKTSSNTRNKTVDTSLRSRNDRNTREFGNQRTVIVARARENVDDEMVEQELKAHYMYMAKIQEVPTADSGPTYDAEPLENVHSDDDYNMFVTNRQHFEKLECINDTYVVEKVDSNVTPNLSDMCDNEGTIDQNVEEPEDERVILASLIANFKLDVDENKKSQK
ncbi:hypothetical protein Tco_1198770, partial [Tanacetum coccineum]